MRTKLLTLGTFLLLVVATLSCVGSSKVIPESAKTITGPLVVSDRWPQCTDLKTWTQDVMRLADVEDASETAKGKAFFEWIRLFNRMATGGMIQAFEGEYGNEQSVLDTHKNLFVYGWGFCDTHSRIASAAWQEYTGDPTSAERVITMHENGGFHTMYRLRLDGNRGAFDARYGYYLIDRDTPDARVLDWIEVGKDENILANKTYEHRSRPFFEFFGREWDRALLVNECYYEDQSSWEAAGRPVECVFGDDQYTMGTRYHDMDFRLARGTTIERFWDNSRKAFYVPATERAKREEPFRPSGRFYRVTDTMFDGNWPKHDPNYQWAEPYLETVPADEGYNDQVSGGRSIGQASGRITYEPELADGSIASLLTPDSTLALASTAPYLRPAETTGGGSATVDFYSPYILVDGALEGELAGGARLEIRTLEAKPRSAEQPDVWSEWQTIAEEPGRFHVKLGRGRYNGNDVSIHGRYRFQVRVSVDPDSDRSEPAGLSAFRFAADFENGIMSIPQIFAGSNTVRFKVNDQSAVQGPVTVAYRYQTEQGAEEHEQVLQPSDFQDGEAVYQINAPGLMRCDSLAISY